MKKALLVAGFLTVSSLSVIGQAITLLTFGSYTFADKFYTEDGYEGKVQDGFQWGGGLEFAPNDNIAVELIYQQLDTDGYINYPGAQDVGNVHLSYIMLGGTHYQPVSEKVSGFGTLDLGLGLASTDVTDTYEKFAWGGRLGLRIAPSEKVSIRLHAQLLSMVQAVGAGFTIGTGGAGAGVSGFSSFYQFNLGGSLNLRLK
jgi:opacity protein-like surface antigen